MIAETASISPKSLRYWLLYFLGILLFVGGILFSIAAGLIFVPLGVLLFSIVQIILVVSLRKHRAPEPFLLGYLLGIPTVFLFFVLAMMEAVRHPPDEE